MPRIRKRSPDPDTFAYRLNRAWEWTGWSVSRLSDELRRSEGGDALKGTSAVSLDRYLDGEVVPTIDLGLALASVLRVSPVWLLTGQGLPDPETLSDHVRPLWRIDGPMDDEHVPETPDRRREAEEAFEAGFQDEHPQLGDEWEGLSPTVRIMFGGLLARHMLAARHQGKKPWEQPFWRGLEAAGLLRGLLDHARKVRARDGAPRGESLDSPAYTDLLLLLISKKLHELRDAANPKEDTNGDA